MLGHSFVFGPLVLKGIFLYFSISLIIYPHFQYLFKNYLVLIFVDERFKSLVLGAYFRFVMGLCDYENSRTLYQFDLL